MKTALVGVCNNIVQNFQKIRLWRDSFRSVCNSEIVLICVNSSLDEISMVSGLGITPVQSSVKDTWYINHERLKCTYEFLESSNADLVLVTDVFDVFFQSDPFIFMTDPTFDIFVSGEGVLVNQEPWNADNITKIFPEKRTICGTQEVINSGIIGGKRSSLIRLFKTMYDMCEQGRNDHNIKDQAALIVLISGGLVDNIKIFNLDDGWAMHCAVSGPSRFFTEWGFDKSIKYGIPTMMDGVVKTKSGKVFSMVHQHNRIPEWNSLFMCKFS